MKKLTATGMLPEMLVMFLLSVGRRFDSCTVVLYSRDRGAAGGMKG